MWSKDLQLAGSESRDVVWFFVFVSLTSKNPKISSAESHSRAAAAYFSFSFFKAD